MNFIDMILNPITILMNFILVHSYEITGNYGLSIVILSFSVSLIMFPLFWISERIQKSDRVIKNDMKPALLKLEDVSNSQKKYFYTREIYKQYGYHPVQGLKSLLGLLIQIPFFISAFRLLNSYDVLQGVGFGPIGDLYAPDGMLGGVNLLPILMTLVNLFSGYVYSQSLDKSERNQLFFIAGIFLVLLYNQPAALVLYWTMNNVISIGKNWLFQDKKEKTGSRIVNDLSKIRTSLAGNKRVVIQSSIIFSLFLMVLGVFTMRFGQTSFYSLTPRFSINTALILFDCLFLLILLNSKRNRIVLNLAISLPAVLHVFIMSLELFISGFSIVHYIPFGKSRILLVIYSLQFISLFTYFLINRKSLVNSYVKAGTGKRADYSLFVIITIPLVNFVISNLEYFSLTSTIAFFVILLGVPVVLFISAQRFFIRFIVPEQLKVVFVSLLTVFYLMPSINFFFKIQSKSSIFYFLIASLILIVVFGKILTDRRVVLSLSIFISLSLIISHFINKADTVDMASSEEFGTETSLELYMEDKGYLKPDASLEKPDIYFLVYDAYVDEKSMEILYGIDNSDHTGFLEQEGFTIYDDVYSIASISLPSISPTLDMHYDPNRDSRGFRKTIAGYSTLDDALQKMGYKTNYVLSSYFLKGTQFDGDFNFPEIADSSMHVILQSILGGEFKFNADNHFANYTQSEWMDVKRSVMNSDPENPKFLYTHSGPGHSQNSGTLLPNEIQLFKERLEIANQEMIGDIREIQSVDRDAIIIVAGDHGPYLLGDGVWLNGYKDSEITKELLADRFGLFLAIKWPDDSHMEYDREMHILQDTFFAVLAYIFDDENINNYRLEENAKATLNGDLRSFIIDGKVQVGMDKGEGVMDF